MTAPKTQILLLQFFLYLCVGGISCCADIAVFLSLSYLGFIPLVLASSISFILATLVNYVLSLKFVFARGTLCHTHQIIRLFLIALMGLLLNSLFFWFLISYTPLTPILGKLSAIATAFLWNFWGRRSFVYSPHIPASQFKVWSRFLKKDSHSETFSTSSQQKHQKLLFWAVFTVLFIRLLYIISFPLNFSGDASVYYTMILRKQSHLLMASGYPFLMMWPYHFLRKRFSHGWGTNEDPNWWETHEKWLLGAEPVKNDFSWADVFQNHDFIIFQHSIELLSLLCGFLLAKRYFGRSISILFLVLYGISPLSLEDPSSTLPEWLQSAFFVFWVYFAEKIRRASFSKKISIYIILGVLAALGFLIKFNGLPVFIGLFFSLFLIDREKWKRTLSKIFSATTSFALTILIFIFSFHLPTTKTSTLTMNSWILASKCFEFIHRLPLKPDFGLSSKRILALLNGLPKEHPLDEKGPGCYFRSIDAVGSLRKPYRKDLLWITQATNLALDEYLLNTPYEFINSQPPLLRISYYIGLPEYNFLLRNLYFELIKKFPFQFASHTLKTSIQSLGIKDKSMIYRPLWTDVIRGSNSKEKSRLGYVKFLWPQARNNCYACYHTHVVWLPGLWLFTKLHQFWPPLWSLWSFSFIALAASIRNFREKSKNTNPLIIIASMSILLLFVCFSNCIIELCRVKDYRCIHLFVTMLCAVGIYQTKLISETFLRNLLFKYKLHRITKNETV